MQEEGRTLEQVQSQLRIYLFITLAYAISAQAIMLRFEYRSKLKTIQQGDEKESELNQIEL